MRATARVLTRIGPTRFTLADVATESGLSPATLLQRFGSKRGLLLAFARVSAAEAGLPFEQARAKLASPLAALRLALVQVSKDLSTRQEVANSLAVLLTDMTDPEMRTAALSHARAIERAIRTLLDESVSLGELPATDTARLALSIQAAWNGAIIQWALRDSGTFPSLLARVLGPLLAAGEGTKTTAQRRKTRTAQEG